MTIGLVAVPVLLTLICLAFMFRPVKHSGGFLNLPPFERIVWPFIILFIWMGYLGYGWYNAEQNKEQPSVEIQINDNSGNSEQEITEQ